MEKGEFRMRAVIVMSHSELKRILSCPNSALFILHKKDKIFIDSVKSYSCPLIDDDYALTRSIVNESSKFHPEIVEIITID